MKISDQNGRLKGKISRPKADAGEVRRLKQGLYAVKRDLFAFEMGAKQLPQQVYTGLRSRRVVKMKTTKSSWAMAKNTGAARGRR